LPFWPTADLGFIHRRGLMAQLNKYGVEITRMAVTKLETGFRCVRDYEVVALAKILKTTPQYLLTGRAK